jgi:hypothetical protein
MGVVRALQVIAKQLDLTMAFCGHTDIRNVGREVILPHTYPPIFEKLRSKEKVLTGDQIVGRRVEHTPRNPRMHGLVFREVEAEGFEEPPGILRGERAQSTQPEVALAQQRTR